MSDLIKKGEDIEAELFTATMYDDNGEKSDLLLKKKWVSVSLLLENIKERKKGLIDEHEPFEDDTFEYGAWEALKWFESLLKGKTMDEKTPLVQIKCACCGQDFLIADDWKSNLCPDCLVDKTLEEKR